MVRSVSLVAAVSAGAYVKCRKDRQDKLDRSLRAQRISTPCTSFYVYQCTPHIALGMIGVIQVGSPSNIDDVRNSISSLEGMIVMNKERVQQYLADVK